MKNGNTNSASRILNVIKSASKPNPSSVSNIVHGVVTSIAPLKIKVDNRLEITEEFLLLGSLCQEQIIKIPTEAIVKHLHIVPQHTTESDCPAHPHTHVVLPFNTIDAMPQIRLWRGLIVGDNVIMQRMNNGQTYYVYERVEGIPWYTTSTIIDNK